MKELQEKIKKFCKEHNLESSAEHRVLDTMSKLGDEIAKEILISCCKALIRMVGLYQIGCLCEVLFA